MKLYAVSTYSERKSDEKFWLGIYFAIANSENEARVGAIEHCKIVDPSFTAFVAEVTEAPVDKEMLPRINEILMARKFLEGVVDLEGS